MDAPLNLFTLPPGRVHIMGICGVGAAGVAWMLHLRGWKVSGCDRHVPPTMGRFFAKNGIAILQDHDPAHLADCDVLVHSAAIRADEPELALARAGGMPVLSRGECLAGWVSGLRSVAVCGTHGKTTSACFATRLLQCVGQKPLWCLGGYTPRLLTNAGPRHGELAGKLPPDQIAVAEADESDGTLAYERPAVTLITNIELDHLDHFRGAEEIERCFAAVVDNTREGVAVCADAPWAMRVAARARVPILTFGLSPDATLRAENLRCAAEGSTFTLWHGAERVGDVALPVPGQHNVRNALGAMAACLLLGLDAHALAKALPTACAELPKRRFQWVTGREAPVRVVVDYAHHPTEILALLSVARLQKPKRLRLVFQPHRYSRTRKLMGEFVTAFPGVDELILLPVYAASEDRSAGSESHELYAAMRAADPTRRLLLARDAAEATAYLTRTAAPGDLILAVGAGDVEGIGYALRDELPGAKPSAPDTPAPPPKPSAFALLNQLFPEEVDLFPNEPLARHTLFRVGGEAELLALPTSIPALSALCAVCKARGIPLRFHGGGANTWFSDLGLPGVLCALQGPDFEGFTRTDDGLVTVGAGLSGPALLARLEAEGLAGLEFMQGIPGTVGGWARMNAGAHGHALWERVVEVRSVLTDGQLRHIPARAFQVGYRAVHGLTGMAVIAVTFRLDPSTPAAVREARAAFAARRTDLSGLRCCGSLFRNPPGLSVGATLDKLGAKGWRVGGAVVSDRHANVIVAEEGCTASDLLALKERLRDAFASATGVIPQPEIQGF